MNSAPVHQQYGTEPAAPRRAARRVLALAWLVTLCLIPLHRAGAADRFPQPDFSGGYQAPQNTFPDPRPAPLESLDGVVLIAALALAAWCVLKLRNRKAVVALMVLCLLYFGFWKNGCVCAVGSFQNVTDSVANPGFAVSLVVILFFALPLLFALFFGRVFCAAVCPLGAIQDVVAVRPKRVSPWLAEALSVIPYVYLGLAVLLAATQTTYLVCRFDPFVAFFRFSGTAHAFFVGAVFLVVGIVVARPYCRFLCPYGVLLAWMSRLSWKRVTVTPGECVQCRLCEDACPFGAIRMPTPERAPESRRTGIRRTALAVAAAPLLIGLGVWLGSHLGEPLSRLHENTRVAEALSREDAGLSEATVDTTAFRASGRSAEDLRAEVRELQNRLDTGGAWLGAFVGLVVGVKLIARTIYVKRRDYEPDRGACLACGRCFRFCPVKKKHESPEKGQEPHDAAES